MTPEELQRLIQQTFAPQPLGLGSGQPSAIGGAFTAPAAFPPSGGGAGDIGSMLTNLVGLQQKGAADTTASRERVANKALEAPHAREANGNMVQGGANDPWSNGFFKTDAQRQGVIDSHGGGNLAGAVTTPGLVSQHTVFNPTASPPPATKPTLGPDLASQVVKSNPNIGIAGSDANKAFTSSYNGLDDGQAASNSLAAVNKQFPYVAPRGFGDLKIAEQTMPAPMVDGDVHPTPPPFYVHPSAGTGLGLKTGTPTPVFGGPPPKLQYQWPSLYK